MLTAYQNVRRFEIKMRNTICIEVLKSLDDIFTTQHNQVLKTLKVVLCIGVEKQISKRT